MVPKIQKSKRGKTTRIDNAIYEVNIQTFLQKEKNCTFLVTVQKHIRHNSYFAGVGGSVKLLSLRNDLVVESGIARAYLSSLLLCNSVT